MSLDSDDGYDGEKNTSDRFTGGQGRASGKLDTAAKAFRAATAIVVFGIPLLTGTAAVLGYGVYRAYKRIAGQS